VREDEIWRTLREVRFGNFVMMRSYVAGDTVSIAISRNFREFEALLEEAIALIMYIGSLSDQWEREERRRYLSSIIWREYSPSDMSCPFSKKSMI
jgi:hypothetical protein